MCGRNTNNKIYESKNEFKYGSNKSRKFTSISQRENAVLGMTVIFTIFK